MKKSLKVLPIVLLSLLAAILLLFAVFLIGVNLSFDSMSEKTYSEYIFDIPHSDEKLVVKEYVSFRNSGIAFYIKTDGKEKILKSVTTNEYCPFSNNDYQIMWKDENIVDIRYGFDSTVSKTVSLELKD